MSAAEGSGKTVERDVGAASAAPAVAAAAAEGVATGAAAPASSHLRDAAVRGAVWIGIGFGAGYVLRLISGMILTRQLLTDVYAEMDVAMVFIQGLHMFADVGIGSSVIQHKRGDDPDFLNTAWTLQILRGVVLWGATALIAWPVAVFYDKPIMLILLPVIGSAAIIDAFGTMAMHTLRRRLMRRRIVVMELVPSVIGLTVTIAWVFLVSETVWALVAGSLVASLVAVALSYVILPNYRNRFRWEPAAVHDLLHFGKWVFLSTAITFLAFQADRLIVPKVSGFSLMGVYGRAVSLAVIATGLMGAFAVQLVLPVYSRVQHEGGDLRSSFPRVHASAAAFAALLVTGMLACGPAAVRCLFGPLYHEAGWMLQILAVGAWFQMLEGAVGASLLALGQPRAVMTGNATRLVAVLVFVPLGYLGGRLAGLGGGDYGAPPILAAGTAGLLAAPLGDGVLLAASGLVADGPDYGGFIGMLLGFLAADVARYLVVVRMARANGLRALGPDVALSLVILVASPAAAFGGEYLASVVTAGVSSPTVQALVRFVCQGGLVVLTWVVLYRVWFRHYLRRAGQSPPPGEEPPPEGSAAPAGPAPAGGGAA